MVDASVVRMELVLDAWIAVVEGRWRTVIVAEESHSAGPNDVRGYTASLVEWLTVGAFWPGVPPIGAVKSEGSAGGVGLSTVGVGISSA